MPEGSEVNIVPFRGKAPCSSHLAALSGGNYDMIESLDLIPGTPRGQGNSVVVGSGARQLQSNLLLSLAAVVEASPMPLNILMSRERERERERTILFFHQDMAIIANFLQRGI